MSARSAAFVSLTLVMALAGSQAVAQTTSDAKWAITAGAFFESSDTSLSIDGDIEGTEIDVEEQLGLDDSDTLSRFTADWHFANRHSLQFGYYGLNRSATKQLTGDIIFDGEVYPVDTVVDASLKLSFYEFSYTYWLMKREKSALGLTGGIVSVGVKTSLSAEAQGGGAFETSGKASTDLPVVLIGASFRQLAGQHWNFTGDLTFLPSITYDNYKGSSLNVSAGVEYLFLDHYGVGAAYNIFGIDFEAEGDRAVGSFEYDIEGPQMYAKFYW